MSRKLPIPTTRPARRSAAGGAGDDYGQTDGPDWRLVDWAAHLRQTTVGGVALNYVDLGRQGPEPPIVFVHGLSGQWQNWLENLPRFAQSRRVVALDLPGFGRSEMPAGEISIESTGGSSASSAIDSSSVRPL